ncbi:MAG: T9SS type A sorting domain-containing protein, partial [Marinoscillum sp.]
FYVLITYPLGIQYPQGSVSGQETVPGRYYYFDEGSWYNLQQVASFETMGWLMYAAEETAGDAPWLTITSDLSGEVAMGAESSISLAFSGALAKRGDQIAEVVITSNDPNNPEARIPVSLHMNEAPMFAKVPASLFVHENDTLVASFEVTDSENNAFTVTAVEEYSNLSFAESNGLITLTLTPNYGDEGTYSYTFVATDEYGATAEVTLNAEVAHTNQAPKLIATEPLVQIKGEALEYLIGEFFSDPDGDEFTFTVTSSENGIAEVFAASDKFLISSKTIGETTLTFTTTDAHGAVSVETINLTVGAVMGTAKEAEGYGISVFPNPTTSKLHIQLPDENRATSKVRLINLLGISVMEMSGEFAASSITTLDLTRVPTGIYFIEITDQTGTYTTRILKD